jgi:hypothetical protein
LNPRIGASYDLFGNGRTALKASLNRYTAVENIDIASSQNPITTTINSTTRVWQDLNGDFLPQSTPGCNYPSVGCELGPLANAAFGQQNITSVYAPGALSGWGKRRYNWELSGGITQALTRRVSVDFAFYRRTQGNFTSADNLNLAPSDFDQFCVTAPVDPLLPNSGQQVCGLYDQNVSKVPFGTATNTVVSIGNPVQQQTDVWQGADLSFNARLGKSGFVSGGFDTGKEAFSNCGFLDRPTQFCAYSTPFLTQYKVTVAYTIPWQSIQASAALQNLPGPQITATKTYTNAEIFPSLQRNLSNGQTGTYAVSLIAPGTMYGDRLNQLDVRLSKTLKFAGAKRLQVMVDVFNALNVSTAISQNNTYGPIWLQPGTIEVGRFFKLGAQFNF